ncbi:uncharacterized protein CTRU02_202724 [Colletotrichum truncatum]|uniref:Uncharacterized protein n=1 Tax=Colletotrichum truncatum TaxID=5467 RepID=A0ACC3ZL22_COLTU
MATCSTKNCKEEAKNCGKCYRHAGHVHCMCNKCDPGLCGICGACPACCDKCWKN